jgi:hypothetical protein
MSLSLKGSLADALVAGKFFGADIVVVDPRYVQYFTHRMHH